MLKISDNLFLVFCNCKYCLPYLHNIRYCIFHFGSRTVTYFHFAFFWNFSDLITLDKIVFNLRKSVWSSDFSPYKTTKHKRMSPQFVPSPLVGLWPLRSWCPEEYHHHRKRLIISILEKPFCYLINNYLQ